MNGWESISKLPEFIKRYGRGDLERLQSLCARCQAVEFAQGGLGSNPLPEFIKYGLDAFPNLGIPAFGLDRYVAETCLEFPVQDHVLLLRDCDFNLFVVSSPYRNSIADRLDDLRHDRFPDAKYGVHCDVIDDSWYSPEAVDLVFSARNENEWHETDGGSGDNGYEYSFLRWRVDSPDRYGDVPVDMKPFRVSLIVEGNGGMMFNGLDSGHGITIEGYMPEERRGLIKALRAVADQLEQQS